MPTTDAPTVAMLWESVDPHTALTSRFGFTDAAAATRWLADTLAAQWGIALHSCERIVISAGNALAWLDTSAGSLLAKWSVRAEYFPRLAELARLTAWLDGRGLPVSALMPARDGRLQLELDGVSLGLQSVIAGALMDADDQAQVYATGAVLARLHQALADYPHTDRIAVLPGDRPSAPLADQLRHWLESTDPTPGAETLRDWVAALPAIDGMSTQLIHSDIRSANVFCDGPRVVALLDFDDAYVDYPVHDLAHAAVLLGTRFRNWGPVPVSSHRTLVAGYESVRPLSSVEREWLSVVVLWRTLGAARGAGDDPTGWGQSVRELIADR